MSLVIGVVGGGQLARMMIPAAQALGIEIRVLAESDDSSASLAASVVGDYRDLEVLRAFAIGVDVVTFDHEHTPTEHLEQLVREGVDVHPGPHALVFAQDKSAMRERLSALPIPKPAWERVEKAAEAEGFIADHGGIVIAKTPRGGYDGKGVRVIETPADIADWLELGPVLLEQRVDFRRELAQLIARTPSGHTRVFPLVQTTQEGGVCAEVIAPAPETPQQSVDEAARIATVIASELNVTGVLAVEMFESHDGHLYVNELAMRPHNSGHVFTEAAVTSQFEQHLRAVADWPLGEATLRQPWAVMVNLFGDAGNYRVAAALASSDRVRVHAYGKSPRAGRKAGHVVVCGEELETTLATARAAANAHPPEV